MTDTVAWRFVHATFTGERHDHACFIHIPSVSGTAFSLHGCTCTRVLPYDVSFAVLKYLNHTVRMANTTLILVRPRAFAQDIGST